MISYTQKKKRRPAWSCLRLSVQCWQRNEVEYLLGL
uniref:Uncharacterized protein n=1 Tax=Arundo donax TaxID=35708 RepID=A0A0A9AHG9_ARUDO